MINRNQVYAEVMEFYQNGEIVNECPLFMAYHGEKAIDEGGVTRDMFSGFWDEAFSKVFEGDTLLVPLIHPSTDLAVFSTLGKILSHCYLVSGILPVRITLPSLLVMLLGPGTNVSKCVLFDALMDYVSENERQKLVSARHFRGKTFSAEMLSDLLSVLSKFGCREMPTPANLTTVLFQIAQFEFCAKPAAALSLIFSGVPDAHKTFWRALGPDGIGRIYESLAWNNRL